MLDSLSELPLSYAVVICDIWGCVHDGVRAYPKAVALLRTWRTQGRNVVLLTNAPRPSARVRTQLARLGVDESCYDAVVSSGDAGVAYVRDVYGAAPLGFIGTPEDREALEEAGIRISADGDCDAVICMGYEPHESENASAYDDVLAGMGARDALLLCFNPDRVVVNGDRLALCAGTIADRYEAMGRRTLYFGKPYRPIYDHALRIASEARGAVVEPHEVVAIGDGVATDLKGAAGYGLDFVFVSGGVEAARIAEVGEAVFLENLSNVEGLTGFAPLAILPALR